MFEYFKKLFSRTEAKPKDKPKAKAKDLMGWKFTFGKYKGKTLAEVSRSHGGYISYCYNRIEWFKKMIDKDKKTKKTIFKQEVQHSRNRAYAREAWAYSFPNIEDDDYNDCGRW